MTAKEVLSLIEQFETVFDTYHQSMANNIKEILQKLNATWKQMKEEEQEIEKAESQIKEQDSELTELRTKSEDIEKKIEGLKTKKDELTSQVNQLRNNLDTVTDNLKKPKFEVENLTTKITTVNEKITTRESEKSALDQKKFEDENKETELNSSFSKKMEGLEETLTQIKQKNFFSSYLMENSDDEIIEVDILAAIMEKGTCNLDDIKKQLDVPPIMAVRTIKQLAIKEVIELNEDTNEIKLL